jgi:hypothetical protein
MTSTSQSRHPIQQVILRIKVWESVSLGDNLVASSAGSVSVKIYTFSAKKITEVRMLLNIPSSVKVRVIFDDGSSKDYQVVSIKSTNATWNITFVDLLKEARTKGHLCSLVLTFTDEPDTLRAIIHVIKKVGDTLDKDPTSLLIEGRAI